MCLNPVPIKLKPDSSRSLVLRRFFPQEYFDAPEEILAPCGKCAECVRNRQDMIMARIHSESKNWSRLHFLTLTYRDENIPLSKSLWKVRRSDGVYTQVSMPEIMPEDEYTQVCRASLSEDFKDDIYNNRPRVLENYIESYSVISDRYDYYERVTPSLSSADFQKCFKLWRVRYERQMNKKLPEFKYIVCGEYGMHRTRRPHYHIVFLSNELQDFHVKMLGQLWFNRFGNYDLRSPAARYDEDGRDQFSLIAQYIGKYVTKGAFEISTVRDKLALSMRFCTSKALGRCLSEDKISEFRCYNMFGKWDPWTVHEKFMQDQLNILIENIVKRSFYSVQYRAKKGEIKSKDCPIPISFKFVIYDAQIINGEVRWPPIYYLVSRYLRNKHIDNDTEQFNSFINAHSELPLSQAVAQYEFVQGYIIETKRKALEERQKKFYSEHSKVF